VIAIQAAVARHRAFPLFLGIAIGVYTTGLAVAGRLASMDRASVIATCLTMDLVVVVPLAFHWLVVRRRRLPAVTLAPVFVLSVVAASHVLPADHQQSLRVLETLAIPVELALISWIGWRAATALRKAGREAAADPLERFRQAALHLTGNDRIAAVFALEIGVFHYAFAAWRAKPHVTRGSAALTHHRRSGHGWTVLALLFLMVVEGVAVHLLLREWHTSVAWLFTAGTAYCVLWLIADYRATVLRPILVGDDGVLIRAGFRGILRVPRACIAEVGRTKPAFGKESHSLAFLRTPSRWLTFSEPMLALGPYGFRRRVRAIGIEPDNVEEFDRVLATLA